MHINTKVRIKDIAKLAGVSEGTVDRVIHKRGEVSAKSKEAVERVLDEINYSPNILARSLASKKQFIIYCLIPEYVAGDYWEAISNGFKKAENQFEQYNVILKILYYNQYDIESFKQSTATILNELPDALIMAPIFKSETITFTNTLTSLHIPFCFIDSLIEETEYTSYYGQNSFLSGYIGGKLLFTDLEQNSQVLIIRNNRKGAESNQTLKRIEGFHKFINDSDLQNVELINIEFNDVDNEENLSKLQQVCLQNSNIKAAIVFNSKVYRLATLLSEINMGHVKLIGYDLLSENVKYLKNNIVSYLISQRPEKQSYMIINDLCKKYIFNQDIQRNNFVPIDILIKENIEDYLNFQE